MKTIELSKGQYDQILYGKIPASDFEETFLESEDEPGKGLPNGIYEGNGFKELPWDELQWDIDYDCQKQNQTRKITLTGGVDISDDYVNLPF